MDQNDSFLTMKKFFQIVFLLFLSQVFSQVSKDLDKDGILDSVTFDTLSYRIVCKLSSQKFQPMYSREIQEDAGNFGVRETKNGFECHMDFMRAGWAGQFRYDVKSAKIQLIGMSRYEFGNAANDGSGNSSVNLLTDDYTGSWYVFDYKKDKLVALPVIRTKMEFPKVFLEDFSDTIGFDFQDRCSQLYYQQKEKQTATK